MGAAAGEDGTIGERLATADAARFVGRRAELERLESLLVEVPERNIVLLHGSGGIGKSTLLRELVRRADRAGWPSRIIEARDLPEQPRGLQAVLDDLRSSPRALVVFDSWEEAELLTPHLQDLVLRDLPAGWVVVISGRQRAGRVVGAGRLGARHQRAPPRAAGRRRRLGLRAGARR